MKKKVKVKMVVGIAGLADPLYDLEEFSFSPEQEVEIHPELAKHWIACGHCTSVDGHGPEIETATLPEPETATVKYPKEKKHFK